MSNPFLKRVNPKELSRASRTFEGHVPVAAFSRLNDSLLEADGELQTKLEFTQNEDGFYVVHGAVRGNLTQVCQRCMQAMSCPVDSTFSLVMVAQDEARELPEQYEVLWLATDEIQMSDLIEEELMLAIPFSPMHKEQCADGVHEHNEQIRKASRPNPFEALAQLKK